MLVSIQIILEQDTSSMLKEAQMLKLVLGKQIKISKLGHGIILHYNQDKEEHHSIYKLIKERLCNNLRVASLIKTSIGICRKELSFTTS